MVWSNYYIFTMWVLSSNFNVLFIYNIIKDHHWELKFSILLIFSPIRIIFDKLWKRDENYILYLLVGQKIILMIYEDFEKIGMFSLYYRLIGICK